MSLKIFLKGLFIIFLLFEKKICVKVSKFFNFFNFIFFIKLVRKINKEESTFGLG